MTVIKIELPDDLAQRASKAGLLTGDIIQQILEEAIRRKAGCALLDVAKQIQEAGISPMSRTPYPRM
jgi:hypothetical protein